MEFQVPNPVQAVLNRYHRAGYEAYIVGGAVRDWLSDRYPNDWDITVSATPKEGLALFSDCRVIETGIKHGTITILLDDMSIEATTFRIDGSYSDCRHPDNVVFSHNLFDDLSRRDFTVCAMAYDIQSNSVIDPFGGQQDLEKGTLSAVGNPSARFKEDPLRILRGLRFCSELGFIPSPKTRESLLSQAYLLKCIAPERIFYEMSKILCGPHAKNVLEKYRSVFEIVIPKISDMVDFPQKNPHHLYDVWTHTLFVLDGIPPIPEYRWAALLHDMTKPDCLTVDDKGIYHFRGHQIKGVQNAIEILTHFHADNRFIQRVTDIIRIHDEYFSFDKSNVIQKLTEWGEQLFLDFVEIRRADTLGKANPENGDQFKHQLLDLYCLVKTQHIPTSIHELAITGDDILSLGLSGKAVGLALKKVLTAVQSGSVENRKESILQFLLEEG